MRDPNELELEKVFEELYQEGRIDFGTVTEARLAIEAMKEVLSKLKEEAERRGRNNNE